MVLYGGEICIRSGQSEMVFHGQGDFACGVERDQLYIV